MSRGWIYRTKAVLLGGLLLGCVERYEPEVPAAKQSYLVVDGFINPVGVTSIKLSHTIGLRSAGPPAVETRARCYVESDQGQQYPLTESATAGTYASASLRLATEHRYRLHLVTQAGREYVSDYTEPRITPEIDSVTWDIAPRGLEVKVNTHDATARSRYYRWSYDETWEFTSAIQSQVEYRNRKLYPRRPANQIFQCWASGASSNIVVGNTTRLSQDRVTDFRLLTLPPTAWQLRIRYSLLVQQRAQTPEEYQYWEQLQKNTESIGSIYDALPTQLTGNVHCTTDAGEQVLGFVGTYTVTQKRIFIDHTQLPLNWMTAPDLYANCTLQVVFLRREFENAFGQGQFVPIKALDSPQGDTTSATAASPECIDCRRRGTNVRPSYW